MKLPEYWIAEFKYKVERVIKWLLARDLNCRRRMHSVIPDRKFPGRGGGGRSGWNDGDGEIFGKCAVTRRDSGEFAATADAINIREQEAMRRVLSAARGFSSTKDGRN